MDPIPRRGRGAALNPANRFDTLHVEIDAGALSEDERRTVPTRFLRDDSRTVLSRNDSPDIPFTYSLNPYRGCEHGCAYCLGGDTLVLMADCSVRPLSEIRRGDLICGTVREGHCRRFAESVVLDHWQSAREASRVTLADGTVLIASGDHRFLTDRGWKHVSGRMNGHGRRPYLTENNSMLGVGHRSSATSPGETERYRLGYLTGIIRGDAHLKSYYYERSNGRDGTQHQFRLALADPEPLSRAKRYLELFGVQTREFLFSEATPGRRRIVAIRTSSREAVNRIRALTDWPDRADEEWDRGFLAGFFDAEGSFSGAVLRFSNTDPSLLAHTSAALREQGYSIAKDSRPVGASAVRLRGGLEHHLRFMQWADPALKRRRSIFGQALKTGSDLRVVAVEPLGRRIPMFDITTTTGDFIANGVVSHNCYARPSHEYLGFSAGLDFETRILVKDRAPDLLAREFERASWEPQVVALSGNTDPYQPVERSLGLSRSCLEVFLRYRNPVSIVTKNHLVTRDIDLLAQMAALNLVHVSISVTSLDDGLIGAMEPRTSRPARRLEAIRRLSEAGVPVGVLVAPVVPGLTDEEMPAILERAAEAGAKRASYIVLRLPGAVEPIFLEWLRRERPLRYDRVVGRLESLRGGRLNDARFGSRMRGEGPWARLFSRLFHMTTTRLGMNLPDDPLATDLFRRDQLELF
jgi:DNA repair photolyase